MTPSQAAYINIRSAEEIHEAENFFNRRRDFIKLSTPLVSFSVDGRELRIRLDEDLEKLKSRFNLRALLPVNDFQLGCAEGLGQQLSWSVANLAALSQPSYLVAAAAALLTEPGFNASGFSLGKASGGLAVIRWLGGSEWSIPSVS